MAADTALVPNAWRTHIARQFIESINESANSSYYMFFGDAPAREEEPAAITDDVNSTVVAPYKNMVAGKRVGTNVVSLVIRNIPYVGDTVYAMYDDQDENLLTKDYYTITNAGSFFHVWKCLDNNQDANSTVEPDFADIDAIDEVYETSDGYRWKYMYSISDVNSERFSTTNYFPAGSNTSVEDHAVAGAIDIIKVDDDGEGYGNYLTDAFAASEIRVNGNATLYALGNSVASSINSFYTGTLLYLSSGTGAGQHRRIVDYFVNANGRFAVINSAFTTSPTNGTQYEIYPEVRITGDGNETTFAIARALVNASAANSIYRVEMLDRGSGYTFATANVLANDVVSVVSNAEVRVISSPPGGHGSDAAVELGCRAVTVAVTFANNEGNTIPANTKFQQVGILRDPKFANVQLVLNSASVTFSTGEQAKRVDARFVTEGVNAEAGNVTFTLIGGRFDERFNVGDEAIIHNSSNDVYQLISIDAVTSNTFTSNNGSDFTDANTSIFLINSHATEMSVLSVDGSGVIRVSNTPGEIAALNVIIGKSSGAYASVNAVKQGGVNTTFSTFVGCNYYTGSYSVGTFGNDEIVFQGPNLSASSANGVVVAVEEKGGLTWVYVSNQIGEFLTSDPIVGANGAAEFTIATKYAPDIEFGSGAVVYLENIDSVTRSPTASEQIAITLVF